MANQRCVELLKLGVRHWNRWRVDNPEIVADFTGAELSGVDLREAYLKEADFSGADLGEANLSGADLGGADFSGANLSRAHLIMAYLSGADLSGVDLTDADLSDANLSGANLCVAYLFGAYLTNANLSSAFLSQANLCGADLERANLKDADLSEANLCGANLSQADLSGATLVGADLTICNLVETKLLGTDLSGCGIYGISVWDIETDENTKQNSLVITQKNESIVTVDNIEVAQFIYLLLNNQKIRDVINTVTSKVVLILGRFTPERKVVLDAIRENLRKNNFTPVLFDFDKPNDRNFIETVATLAHMARFVIADFTDPKIVLQEAQHIIPNIAIPFVPIFLNGSGFEPITLSDLRKGRTTVLDTFAYNDIEHLIENLNQMIIEPAEVLACKLNEKNPLNF